MTSVLFELYQIKWNIWSQLKTTIFGASRYKTKYGLFIHDTKKHFGCQQIPMEYKNRLVLATMRNPYDWYTSQYEFGWWRKKSMLGLFQKIEDFEKDYPHFPNISFPEFMHLCHFAFETHFECATKLWQKIGWRSRLFLQNFAENPTKTLLKYIQDGQFEIQNFNSDLYQPIQFIQTQSLNYELNQFLLSKGFPAAELEFILNKKKVVPLGIKRESTKSWESYYTPDLKNLVRTQDALMFEYFPAFDI